MRKFKLLKDTPMVSSQIFYFDDETGNVWWEEKGGISEYPLRTGLAGYLWLLLTKKGYFRRIKGSKEV